jgi:hypothetical protein
VFFDIDPGHVGMLEVESTGGKTRAELIIDRPRWVIQATAGAPPQARFVEGVAVPLPVRSRPARPTEPARRAEAPPPADPPPLSNVEPPATPPRPHGNWVLIALVVVVAGAVALQAIRAARRRPSSPPPLRETAKKCALGYRAS